MFLPERYRRNPPQRRPVAPEIPTDNRTVQKCIHGLGRSCSACDEAGEWIPASSDNAVDRAPDAWDEADELAAMSDADFYRQLRQDVAGVREGSVPSITDAMRPTIKDRPWGPRHK